MSRWLHHAGNPLRKFFQFSAFSIVFWLLIETLDTVLSTQHLQTPSTPKTWCFSPSMPQGEWRWKRSWRSLVSLLCRWWLFGTVAFGKRSPWEVKTIFLLFWLATASNRSYIGEAFPLLGLFYDYFAVFRVHGAGVVICFSWLASTNVVCLHVLSGFVLEWLLFYHMILKSHSDLVFKKPYPHN